MNRTRIAVHLLFALLLMPAGHVMAEGENDAPALLPNALYEVTENVNFHPVKGVSSRNATSALLGAVAVGTPLCASEALAPNPGTKTCTVLATGSDEISLVTGIGSVSGDYWVVVNAPGNSTVHVPDCPVESGKFEGTIDFSRPLQGVPIASVTGTFTRTTNSSAALCRCLYRGGPRCLSRGRSACRSASTRRATPTNPRWGRLRSISATTGT